MEGLCAEVTSALYTPRPRVELPPRNFSSRRKFSRLITVTLPHLLPVRASNQHKHFGLKSNDLMISLIDEVLEVFAGVSGRSKISSYFSSV